jgi:Rieske Fe-S protein
MAAAAQSRRRFLVTLAISLAALAGLVRFLKPRRPIQGELANVGIADIPDNAALVLPEERVAIVRNGNEYIALSLVCPHLGCTVTVAPSGLFCPCHGSSFDRLGKLLNGPATAPLHRLESTVKGNRLIVTG